METSTNPLNQQKEAMEDSASENFSVVSDSELGNDNETGDHEILMQELKMELARKDNKISSLEMQLAEAGKSLKQKDTIINEKDDFIKSFKMSIDLMSQNKNLQNEIIDLKNNLDLTKNLNISEKRKALQEINEIKNQVVKLESTMQKFKDKLSDLEEKCQNQDELENFEDYVQVNELNNQMVEVESTIQKLNDKLSELEDNSKIKNELVKRQNNNTTILLNHSIEPHIKFIEAEGISPFTAVFEELPFAGSGWMVIQRRLDGKIDFCVTNKNSYEVGFGDINGDFWLGIETIHQLTTSQRHELIVELVDFDDVTAYARYDNFVVGNKESKYELKSLGNYSGNSGDALRDHEKQVFEDWTYPNKSFYSWWRTKPNKNYQCILNGRYHAAKKVLSGELYDGIWWGNWYLGNTRCTLKSCKMLIRQKFWYG
ncbi:fibrinogen-like protein 1 [Drosophila takahashii]|uniref:fibrinogen-like protein 1 n=1 Tax=Drosophila takahashii TaxID=29030 RepID=UPI003898DD48